MPQKSKDKNLITEPLKFCEADLYNQHSLRASAKAENLRFLGSSYRMGDYKALIYIDF
jgi:hypothetical protein